MMLLSELLKMAVSFAIVSIETQRTNNKHKAGIYLGNDLRSNFSGSVYMSVPALLYVVVNLLIFYNLTVFDAPTYRILINVRVLITAILVQIIFQKRLLPIQWVALLILVAGLGITQGGQISLSSTSGPLSLLSLLMQASCSALAGVYFQWLVQRQETEFPFWQRNFYVYFYGAVVNAIFFVGKRCWFGSGAEELGFSFNGATCLVLFIQTVAGLSTALLLKHLDAVAKEYAGSLEIVAVAVGAWFFFDVPITYHLVAGFVLVSYSLWLYNRSESTLPKITK
eukprot:GILK01017941.1.p1 GENE.GILK01017941.1~~GILK01017941.1.p1  ORF type:complete len:282 (+),score=21.89 GILK01017941.1:127-972(+)